MLPYPSRWKVLESGRITWNGKFRELLFLKFALKCCTWNVDFCLRRSHGFRKISCQRFFTRRGAGSRRVVLTTCVLISTITLLPICWCLSLQLLYLSAIDRLQKMRLNSLFEGVTITQKGILICKCTEEMVERVKKTASEPFTDDDKCNDLRSWRDIPVLTRAVWRCPRVKPPRD